MYNKFIAEYPPLCMVVGVPGSGKSVLARQIAYRVANAAYESKDRIQQHFTWLRGSDEIYSMVTGPTFELLVDFSDTQLYLHKMPVIDAPFSINHTRDDQYRDWVPRFREVADRRRAGLLIVRCLPPSLDKLRTRIEERYKTGKFPRDEWKLKNWDEFLRQEPLDFPIPHDDVCMYVSERLSAPDFSDKMESIITRFLGAERIGRR